jgi:hypothetical protein
MTPSKEEDGNTMLKKICALALLVGMINVTPVISAAPPNPNPVQGDKDDQHKKKGVERHPHIRAAIRELQEARKELETAAHDFGGHRKEAIEAIDNALKQLREALEYDKK